MSKVISNIVLDSELDRFQVPKIQKNNKNFNDFFKLVFSLWTALVFLLADVLRFNGNSEDYWMRGNADTRKWRTEVLN